MFRSVSTTQYNNYTCGSNFNQLINTGLIHPTGALTCPSAS